MLVHFSHCFAVIFSNVVLFVIDWRQVIPGCSEQTRHQIESTRTLSSLSRRWHSHRKRSGFKVSEDWISLSSLDFIPSFLSERPNKMNIEIDTSLLTKLNQVSNQGKLSDQIEYSQDASDRRSPELDHRNLRCWTGRGWYINCSRDRSANRTCFLPERSTDRFFFVLVVSYNQPNCCPNASWNPNAITFASQTTSGFNYVALYITTKNTLVVPHYASGQILIWHNATGTPTASIPAGLSTSYSVFVTNDDGIFVDNDVKNGQLDRWTARDSILVFLSLLTVLWSVCRCEQLSLLFCTRSSSSIAPVARRSTYPMTIMVGTDCPGSTANRLHYPYGIFVTTDLHLYVADAGNHRVQLFRSEQRNAATVAGNGATETIILNWPTGVAVDGDGYLFILDSGYHRIVGSSSNGFRCVVGCSGATGAGSDRLQGPSPMSFDTDRNIFVADTNNNRIQQFLFARDSCGE